MNEFFRNAQQSNFSPPQSKEKLQLIQQHIKTANGGREVSKDKLYNFLKHFYLLSYDLGSDEGASLSLIYSHISQFQSQNPQLAWSTVVDLVQTRNQSSGTITLTASAQTFENSSSKKLRICPKNTRVPKGTPNLDATPRCHLFFGNGGSYRHMERKERK